MFDRTHKWALQLWWLAALVPLILFLIAFLMHPWYWGIMDDTSHVLIPGGIQDKIVHLLTNFYKDGRLLPVISIHSGTFYTVFKDAPHLFYIFRWAEIALSLGIWALFVFKITKRSWCAGFFTAAALSFFKFYDGFFYVSLAEPLGVFFTGLACYFFYEAFEHAFNGHSKLKWPQIILGAVSLLLAMGSKETFFVVAGALGVSAIAMQWNKRTPLIFWTGIGLLLLAAVYVVSIKLFLLRGYSVAYDINQSAKLIENIKVWLTKGLLSHLPLIALSVLLMLAPKREKQAFSIPQRFALCLGVLLYAGYLLVILPWSTWGHYVLPLGVFFAFTVTVALSNLMERVPSAVVAGAVIMILLINMSLSLFSLKWQYGIQRDVLNLASWMAENSIFRHDLANGAKVRGNAYEPCFTIPTISTMRHGAKFPFTNFIVTGNVGEVMADISTRYYLWGVHWGNQDLRRLGEIWTPVFVSDHWVMFRRMQ